MKQPVILAIDTSCDETSVAVSRGRRILSNVIASQVNIHKKWGGVVPHLAKRAHLEKIEPVTKEALARFGTPRASSEPKKVVSHSPQQTINLAKTIMLKNVVSLTTRPLVFLLIGDLGAGKTQFAKGIGQFLKIKQPITSPTYTIEKEYPYTRHSIKGLFIHLDTWRLQNIEELKELKLETRLKPKNVIAIEWADRTQNPILKLAKQANAKIIQIIFKSSRQSPSQRQLTILAN